ncbi:unnamed protein product [Cunninghamella echinulata]
MSLADQCRLWLNANFPSQAQLENLRYYQYSAVDKSYVTKYILRHYWNWAIELFPLWIAPNLITLIGLFFMIFNVGLVYIYSNDFIQEAPSWVYLSFAIGLWLYSTFDNVDGKQARRTGTSSPLGELFDHGCDALNTTYITILQIAAFGLGNQGALMILLFMTTTSGFFLSTIEEYYTGILYLGYVNGPTEGLILTCFAFLWTWWCGMNSWQVPFSELDSSSVVISFLVNWLGVPPETTTGAHVFVWGTIAFFIVTHLPMVLYAILKACEKKKLHPGEVLYGSMLPIIIFSFAQYYWCLSSYSIIFSHHHFLLFALTNGTLFGLMVSSVILNHLTKQPFPNLFILVTPVMIMSVLINAPNIIGFQLISPHMELVLLWTQFIAYTMGYGIWIILVIDGFCKYLGIQCLVIPKPKNDELDRLEQGNNSVFIS